MKMKTRQWVLADKPSGLPTVDGPDPTFQLVETELAPLKDGEVLVSAKYLSNDPSQRARISPYANSDRMYIPLVSIGEVVCARGVAEVVESKSPLFQKGDTVVANVNWAELAILPAAELRKAAPLPRGLSASHYLGAFGICGLAAYFGLTEAARATSDDIVVVSGAAGATGMMAVQIAKNLLGCKRVIGIAGSEESCAWVQNRGADLCLNYKSPSFKADLQSALPGPDGYANVYFDNVGGEILELMLGSMAKFGRIAACGAISNSNTPPAEQKGIRNWNHIVGMRISVTGFVVVDYMSRFPEVIGLLQKAVAEGKLNVEGTECMVEAGFEEIPRVWLRLFEGSKRGKLVTSLRSPPPL